MNIPVTVTLALNPTIMEPQCVDKPLKATRINPEYGTNAINRLAEVVLRGHWHGWQREYGNISFEEFLVRLGRKEGMLYPLWAVIEASGSVLPGEGWADPSKSTTIVLSRNVGYIKTQKPDPASGIYGSGVKFVIQRDGSLLMETTFPSSSYGGTPYVTNRRATLAFVSALSDLSLPISKQSGGREILDPLLEDLDQILRPIPPAEPLIAVEQKEP
jgi:hypothetical protein